MGIFEYVCEKFEKNQQKGKDAANATVDTTKTIANGTVNATKSIANGTVDVTKTIAGKGKDITVGAVNITVQATKTVAETGKDITIGAANVTKDLAVGTAKIAVNATTTIADKGKDLVKGTINISSGLVGSGVNLIKEQYDNGGKAISSLTSSYDLYKKYNRIHSKYEDFLFHYSLGSRSGMLFGSNFCLYYFSSGLKKIRNPVLFTVFGGALLIPEIINF